ncbi:MAG TPA: hypothetical protein VMZ33_01070 [Candidatus Limnocylindrales bacterium]|nr:hypothetical protein [Candidatus Limnocylindrales bacterium]
MGRRDEDAEGYNAERRAFFRTFGRQSVRSAGAVVGAAAELRRAGGDAARELFALGQDAPNVSTTAAGPTADGDAPPDGSAAQFRSPYLVGHSGLTLLDQRVLPGRLETIAVRRASEIASAIRASVVNSGPVLADIAAFGLAEIARSESPGRAAQSFDQVFRAAIDTLRTARSDVHALTATLDRMQSRYEAIAVGEGDVAQELRAEAEAIVGEATTAHATLARTGAEVLAAAAAGRDDGTPGTPLDLLMHGDSGPLSCGVVGTGTALIQALIATGRSVHVWVTRAEPSAEGARITSLQLAQVDVPHTVIADAAVGWLMAARSIDGVLLRGDTVVANGDVAALIGSRGVAHLAATADVAVYALAPRTAWDANAADAGRLSDPIRSTAETLAAMVGNAAYGRPQSFAASLSPRVDVLPRDLISAYLTEDGPQPGGRV